MKRMRFVIWIALIAVFSVCFVACVHESGDTSKEMTTSLAEILAPQRSQVLECGETLQLQIPNDADVTIYSSDEKVVTVDDSGLVTAVGQGMALITVSNGNGSAYCGVLVAPAGDMIDVTKLSAEVVFSDLELHATAQITGLAVDSENQTVYFAQSPLAVDSFAPLNSDVLISKVEKTENSWELGSWMRFSGSGKGSICVDNDGKTPRLWMECSGDYIGYGKAISLVDWSDNEYGIDSFGQVFKPQGISGGMTVTADTENNMVLVYDRAEKCYRIYNRVDMLEGNSAPQYVHAFQCKANQTPVAGNDDSQGRYNASIRGYALYDGYLYQFSGSSSIYVSVFDLEGNLQYCYRMKCLPDADYYMPASICVSDGKIYVAIATGADAYNLANLLVFK